MSMRGWKTLTLTEKMKYLETAVYDCSFQVSKTPEDTKVIKSYKYILSSVSPTFYRMFSGCVVTYDAPTLKDTDAVDFEMFLKYITNGGATLMGCSKLSKLNNYCLAKKYGIGEMQEEICKGLCESFKSSDPCYVLVKALTIAIQLNDQEVVNDLKKHIGAKPDE